MSAITKTIELAQDAAKARREHADWYVRNATAKHGVPPPAPDKGPDKIKLKVVAGEKASPKDLEKPDDPPGPWDGVKDRVGKWSTGAMLAALLSGAGVAGLGTWGLMELLSDKPAVEKPVDGSLLQDLEDRGFHLPQE